MVSIPQSFVTIFKITMSGEAIWGLKVGDGKEGSRLDLFPNFIP
jgi:hypothetical protein